MSVTTVTMDTLRMRVRHMDITGRSILWAACLSGRGSVAGLADLAVFEDAVSGGRASVEGDSGFVAAEGLLEAEADSAVGMYAAASVLTADAASAEAASVGIAFEVAVEAAFMAAEDSTVVEDSMAAGTGKLLGIRI
jgi:hypothetical protein